jgi:hypothetical protein
MTSSLWGKDVLFIRNDCVFDDSFESNCRYTIVENRVYLGQSTSIFDLLYEIENGKVYQISNSSVKKCIFTFSNNQIFIGDSSSVFDCLFSFEVDNSVVNNEILLLLAIAPF